MGFTKELMYLKHRKRTHGEFHDLVMYQMQHGLKPGEQSHFITIQVILFVFNFVAGPSKVPERENSLETKSKGGLNEG